MIDFKGEAVDLVDNDLFIDHRFLNEEYPELVSFHETIRDQSETSVGQDHLGTSTDLSGKETDLLNGIHMTDSQEARLLQDIIDCLSD